MEIVIIPIIIIPILGVKLGVVSAKNRNRMKDTVIRGGVMLAVCIPSFWLAIMIQYFFGTIMPNWTYGAINIEVMHPNSVTMRYEPITGFRLIDAFLLNDQVLLHDTLLHLYLPCLCLIIITFAGITRQTRASMLEVMRKDYVRTARAKGVTDKDVTNKHTLRNSLIPTSTAIIGTTAGLLTGSLFIEMAFNYTGMGFYMIRAMTLGDYVVINGILVFSSIIIMIGTLSADILYTIIDPRIVYT
jgi:peptide/nickel transport system permease protein